MMSCHSTIVMDEAHQCWTPVDIALLDLLKFPFSSVELTTLTFHPLHKLMTSHIQEEAIERLL